MPGPILSIVKRRPKEERGEKRTFCRKEMLSLNGRRKGGIGVARSRSVK